MRHQKLRLPQKTIWKECLKWKMKSCSQLVLGCLYYTFCQRAKLPKSYYEAKKSMKKVGLGYESIDACINDCRLFWGKDNKDEEICPTCKASRRQNKDTTGKKVPNHVFCYFPLIPILKRINFPARSSLSDWSGQSYLACPTCNKETPSTRVNGKTIYVGHRRFLPIKHRWRNDKTFKANLDDLEYTRLSGAGPSIEVRGIVLFKFFDTWQWLLKGMVGTTVPQMITAHESLPPSARLIAKGRKKGSDAALIKKFKVGEKKRLPIKFNLYDLRTAKPIGLVTGGGGGLSGGDGEWHSSGDGGGGGLWW
nr:hypothetical protein [Tanacetum cinerariifolium]